MNYIISRNILESDKDLFVSKDGFAWTSSPPKNIMIYDNSFLEKNCIRTLLHLTGADVDFGLEKIKSYKHALKNFNEKISLGMFMPLEIYKSYIKELVHRINNYVFDNTNYYYKNYITYDVIFDSLSRSCIDKQKLQFYTSKKENLSNMHVLATFLPNEDGFSKKIKYDRLSSRTGRLKIDSGPSILTLKKEQRDIIKSRYKNGKIISIDYSNLESRVFLYSTGIKIDQDDIYSFIARTIFNDEFPRHIIKTIVISLLYGMGEVAMSAKLNLENSKVKKISKKIRNFFNYDDLYVSLQSKIDTNGRILNHYGRSIIVPDERLLLNTYVQSTAVDVALHGFSKIIKKIENNQYCKPIFVLHDALILDVDENCDLSFTSEGESVPLFDSKFPVHISDF